MNPNSNLDQLQDKVAGGDDATWKPEDYEWDAQNLTATRKPGTDGAPNAPGGLHDHAACSAAPILAQNLAGGSVSGSVPQKASGKGARGKKVQIDNGRPTSCQADGCTKNIAALTYYHVRNR